MSNDESYKKLNPREGYVRVTAAMCYLAKETPRDTLLRWN